MDGGAGKVSFMGISVTRLTPYTADDKEKHGRPPTVPLAPNLALSAKFLTFIKPMFSAARR